MKTRKTYCKALSNGHILTATARFDDECRNGHRTLSITGELRKPREREPYAFGCLHDEIAKHFPELRPLIPYHRCSEDGPLHYVANTLYLAGDRDYHGKRKGEVVWSEPAVLFGYNPILHKFPKHPKFIPWLRQQDSDFALDIVELPYTGVCGLSSNWTFKGYGAHWHEGPFNTKGDAVDFLTALQECNPRFVDIPTKWSEGKLRELDLARAAAIWPDATDEELCQEPEALKAALLSRLPALLADFREKVTAIGLDW